MKIDIKTYFDIIANKENKNVEDLRKIADERISKDEKSISDEALKTMNVEAYTMKKKDEKSISDEALKTMNVEAHTENTNPKNFVVESMEKKKDLITKESINGDSIINSLKSLSKEDLNKLVDLLQLIKEGID